MLVADPRSSYMRPTPRGYSIDPYMLMMLMQMREQQAQQAQEQESGGSGGLAGMAAAGKKIYDLGVDKGWWGNMAPAAGGMSGVPTSVGSGMSLGEIQAMSNGQMFSTPNTALQSMAPAGEAPTTMSNFAGSATPYLGGAATAIGAYNAIQGINKKNPLQAGLGGAGAWGGLNMMGYTLGPAGWAMVAAPAIGALINKLGDKDRWKEEGDRLRKLRERGINVVPTEAENLTRGRSKEELIRNEQDKINRGQWGNVAFAQSRNEKDLRPEDIWGYSAFYEKYGNDWLGKFSEADRRRIAQQALDAGAVSEGRGQIKVDWNKIPSGQPGPSQQPQQQQQPQPRAPQPSNGVAQALQSVTKPQPAMIPKASPKDPNVMAALRGRFGGAFN